jgi:hypothetical protein
MNIFEGPSILINRTQNDMNNTTVLNNQTQVIDDFTRMDIPMRKASGGVNDTNISVSRVIDEIHINLIET